MLRIREWAKYQHYRDRNPPWIKLHIELITSFTWIALDDASRLLAVICMMLAGRTDNKIPLDRDFIQRSAYLKKRPNIQPLIDCGFAEVFESNEIVPCNQPLTNDASKVAQLASTLHTNARPETETETYKPEAERSYVRPTLEEVSAYCVTRQNHVDPEKWFDYYTSNGWRVGRNSMKDWKAAVRTWEKNGFGGEFSNGQTSKAQQRNQRGQRAILDAARSHASERVGVDPAERKG